MRVRLTDENKATIEIPAAASTPSAILESKGRDERALWNDSSLAGKEPGDAPNRGAPLTLHQQRCWIAQQLAPEDGTLGRPAVPVLHLHEPSISIEG